MGFAAMTSDSLSGPIEGVDGVRRAFTDHADDPAFITGHGFVHGHMRAWRQPEQTQDATNPSASPAVLLTVVVVQFDTSDNTKAVIAHLRQRDVDDGQQLFTVPAQLTNGYGVSMKPSQARPDHVYSVAWLQGNCLFDLRLSYPSESSTEQVLAFASAQSDSTRTVLPG